MTCPICSTRRSLFPKTPSQDQSSVERGKATSPKSHLHPSAAHKAAITPYRMVSHKRNASAESNPYGVLHGETELVLCDSGSSSKQASSYDMYECTCDRPASVTAGFRIFASFLSGVPAARLCSCSRTFGKPDRQTTESVEREVYVSFVSCPFAAKAPRHSYLQKRRCRLVEKPLLASSPRSLTCL